MWGPYMEDGLATVDWEKLEAIMLLLRYNTEVFRDTVGDQMMPHGLIPEEAWVGATPGSYESLNIMGPQRVFDEDEDKVPVEDPYNIAGTWMRVRTHRKKYRVCEWKADRWADCLFSRFSRVICL